MVLKLYSAPALGTMGGGGVVALVLAEKQIPFQNIPVNMPKGEHKSPEYRAKQPFGQLPVIDDDGFVLYEMRAICRYLVEKYPQKGPKLLPGPSLQERALFEQAASVEFANFYPIGRILQQEIVIKLRTLLPADQTVESMLAQLGERLDVYENILSKQDYLAGNEITLVDLFHLATLTRVDIMKSHSRPNVARWWNAVTSRPAWVKLCREGIQSTAEGSWKTHSPSAQL